jgi:hypothetical protein
MSPALSRLGNRAQNDADTNVNADQDILMWRRLPARLTGGQVCRLLNLQEYQLAILIRHRLLTALGKPAQNSQKWFCTATLELLCKDEKWLNKITAAIEGHYRDKRRGFKARIVEPQAVEVRSSRLE